MRLVIHEELEEVRKAYGDRRRTHIVQLKEDELKINLLTTTELVPEKKIWISISEDGEVARSLDDKMPRISGREAPKFLVNGNTRHTLYLVCDNGETAAIPVHAIPEAEKASDGVHLTKISPLQSFQSLVTIFTLPPMNSIESEALENNFILTGTVQGMVKKSALSELPGVSANTFTLVKVNEGDHLGWLCVSNGGNDVVLMTKYGMAIRFNENDIRAMGLVAAGVMGIKLRQKDQVVGMELLPQSGEVFMAASDGSAKRVNPDQFPKQGRYGQGVVAWKLPAKVTVIGISIGKGTFRVSLQLKELAAKTVRLDDAPLQGRTARGKKIIELKSGDQIVNMMAPRIFTLPKA